MPGLVVRREADGTPSDPALRNCLRQLAQRGAKLMAQAQGATVEAPRKGVETAVSWIDIAMIPQLDATGWLTGIGDGRFILSPAGRTIVRLMKAAPSPAEATAGGAAAPNPPDATAATSTPRTEPDHPLAWLRTHRRKDGTAYLSDQTFEAGERLRDDFHRAAMMPRVTVDWEAIPRSRSEQRGMAAARGGGGGNSEAQNRVRRALAAVPPELSGLLVDVCCFGHRLQDVERSRDLPQRSVHYLLDIALRVLARHYGLLPPADGTWQPRSRTRHWGGDGYRPTVDGA